MIPDNDQERTELLVLFKIISRQSWDRLQAWQRAHPGSEIEHVKHGIYVPRVPADGAREVAA